MLMMGKISASNTMRIQLLQDWVCMLSSMQNQDKSSQMRLADAGTASS